MSLEETPSPSTSAASSTDVAMETNDAEVNPTPSVDSSTEVATTEDKQDIAKRTFHLLKALYPNSFKTKRDTPKRKRSTSTAKSTSECGDCAKRYDDVVRQVHEQLLSGKLTMVGVTRTPKTCDKQVQTTQHNERERESLQSDNSLARRLRQCGYSVGTDQCGGAFEENTTHNEIVPGPDTRAHRSSARSFPDEAYRSRRALTRVSASSDSESASDYSDSTCDGSDSASDDSEEDTAARSDKASRRKNAFSDDNTPRGNALRGGHAPRGVNDPRGGYVPRGGNAPRAGNALRGKKAPRGSNVPRGGNPSRAGNAPKGGNAPRGENTPRSDNPPRGDTQRNITPRDNALRENASRGNTSQDNTSRVNNSRDNNPRVNTPRDNGSEDDSEDNTPRFNARRNNVRANIARDNAHRFEAPRDSPPRSNAPRSNTPSNEVPRDNSSSSNSLAEINDSSDNESIINSVMIFIKQCQSGNGLVSGGSTNVCRFAYLQTPNTGMNTSITDERHAQECQSCGSYANTSGGPVRMSSRHRPVPYERSRQMPAPCEDDALKDLHLHVLEEDANNSSLAYVDVLENLHQQGPCRKFCQVKADILKIRLRTHRTMSSQTPPTDEVGVQVHIIHESRHQSCQTNMSQDVGIQKGDCLSRLMRINAASKKAASIQVTMAELPPHVRPVSHVTGLLKGLDR